MIGIDVKFLYSNYFALIINILNLYKYVFLKDINFIKFTFKYNLDIYVILVRDIDNLIILDYIV